MIKQTLFQLCYCKLLVSSIGGRALHLACVQLDRRPVTGCCLNDDVCSTAHEAELISAISVWAARATSTAVYRAAIGAMNVRCSRDVHVLGHLS